MMERIAHRGPDDQGSWVNDTVALGHQRLSILDLSDRGHQPFITADGNGILVFNGEVYNYTELRKELEEEGVRFVSTSDTEVALYALHVWGPETAIPRFNGMFGLAYFDQRNRTLVLARDRLGIKPLYIACESGRIVFASEIKALLAHPCVRCVPDRHALAIHAALHRIEGEMTPFEGISALRPGSFWKVTEGSVAKTVFFDVFDRLDVDRIVQAMRTPLKEVDEFDNAIVHSVGIHLASDAPLASMCSGGVDSSLITAIARESRPDITAYVADVKNTVSEGARARVVAKALGIRLCQVDVDAEDLLRLWPEATWFGDQPNTHGNDMPMLAVARACRRDGIKVVLTGEGADELFGGYAWQAEAFDRWRRWRRHPLRAAAEHIKWLRPLLRRFPKPLGIPDAPYSFGGAIPLLGGGNPVDRYVGRLDAAAGLRLLFSLDPNRQSRAASLFHKLEGAGTLEERAFLARGLDDMYGHLESLLKRNDRMGMAASIETRVPFLENRLIDLGMHAPFSVKRRDGHGKWIVKRAAQKRLPREIVFAEKLGFPAAFDYVRSLCSTAGCPRTSFAGMHEPSPC
jgi:asparagine synthase (glutamine-hydrolysing)